MKFFSGFSLQNEVELFEEFLRDSDFTVAGFSYGAIRAFEYVLNAKERIDRLQLLSPALFQDREEKFKRTQLLYFKKDSKKYIESFLTNCSNTSLEKYRCDGEYEELQELLCYEWKREKMAYLLERNIHLEVYIGTSDSIIHPKEAEEFFREFGVVYSMKNRDHALQ